MAPKRAKYFHSHLPWFVNYNVTAFYNTKLAFTATVTHEINTNKHFISYKPDYLLLIKY